MSTVCGAFNMLQGHVQIHKSTPLVSIFSLKWSHIKTVSKTCVWVNYVYDVYFDVMKNYIILL